MQVLGSYTKFLSEYSDVLWALWRMEDVQRLIACEGDLTKESKLVDGLFKSSVHEA